MDFRSLDLQISYDSEKDDILNKFYVPVLSKAKEYNRIVGFFNSSSLAAAAKGIKEFILNDGEMKLICGAKLHKNDIEIIKKSLENPEDFIVNNFLKDIHNLEDQIIKDHVRALGWMIAHKKIKIKIAIKLDEFGSPLDDRYGILHQKIGILTDKNGNKLSFSGSNNETFAAWNENFEEFKLFRGWEEFESRYMNSDNDNFNKYWNEKAKGIKIIDIPIALKNELIKIAPQKLDDLNLSQAKPDIKKSEIELFDYQNEAIKKWEENGKKGIFEMATGTGKTFTALGCLAGELKKSKKMLVVITCPYQHLVQQWKKSVEKFGIDYDDLIIADSSNPSWKNRLSDSLLDICLDDKNIVIVITTHITFSSANFTKIIQEFKGDFPLFLIADEVHGLGAEISLNGLIDDYNYRLALSATPKRWFDELGTETLYNYFSSVVYEFSLEKAINTINIVTDETYLTPYEYHPRFVNLEHEELEEYIRVTKAIATKFNNKNNSNEAEILQSLLFKRSNIIKNADTKYFELMKILDELDDDIDLTIIYCSPQQINRVMGIINHKQIPAHRFTMSEGTRPNKKYKGLSEREFILEKFAEGEYKVLVAMKCLDEGVDVPAAKTAIILSSSGNPREYIQRIGRIIRRYPNKNKASIYDLVVTPSLNKLSPEEKEIEKKIFEKELARCEEIGKIAINNVEAVNKIFSVNR